MKCNRRIPLRRAPGRAALLLACWAGTAACVTYAPRTPAQRGEQWALALHASEEKRWDLAASLWNEIRLGDPNAGVAASVETARALQELGRLDDALAILDDARDRYPGEAKLLRQRGILLDELGFERAAEVDLRMAAEKLPDSPEVWTALGHVQLELSQPLTAADSLEHARTLVGDDVDMLVACARAQRLAGRLDLAEERYEQAIEQTGDNDIALLVEAASLYTDGDGARQSEDYARRAMGWCETAVRSDPQNAKAQFVRGVLFEQDGKKGRAIDAYERAFEIDNFHLGAANNLALLLLERGDSARACEMFERAMSLEDDPRRLAVLAKLCRRAEILSGG